MPEYPLVPDGRLPGSDSASSADRPLTRRELRERQRAREAAQAASAQPTSGPAAGGPAQQPGGPSWRADAAAPSTWQANGDGSPQGRLPGPSASRPAQRPAPASGAAPRRPAPPAASPQRPANARSVAAPSRQPGQDGAAAPRRTPSPSNPPQPAAPASRPGATARQGLPQGRPATGAQGAPASTRRPANTGLPEHPRASTPAESTASREATASAAAVPGAVDPFTAVFGDAFVQVDETRAPGAASSSSSDTGATSFDWLLGEFTDEPAPAPAAPRAAPGPARSTGEQPRRPAAPSDTGKKGRKGRPAPVSDAAGGRKPVRVRVKQRPAGRGTPRRTAAKVASLAAMSFVALMTVATTIPSLSLMSTQDVQAMAMSGLRETQGPQQSVTIDGGTQIASTGHEGYESMTIMEYAEAAGIRPEATFTNNPLGTIQWPFAVGVHIGDRFGYRDCAGCSVDHGGQDFNPGYGAEIQAIADGVVSVAENGGGSLGVHMMIDHVIDGEVVTSVYAHMQYDSMRFEAGDHVSVGDVLGLTGSTGMSTGPHLHFEIRVGGVEGTKVDPLDWLYLYTN
ncbi:M23 family metallopeptidase [Agromyces archimandritae]|uniref:Peptidoglycan DD-metalloendopeptidase family protein n=1 Tax=Agromyces archimandritae TaxID=2781962 RepID=A0A975IP69_9MICO|nr:M23 family metallopeptidase [Agromyces archimandritae]QTX03651.1 peptidoglycan DD-metalloendopeptidase family protein [Agromyces archimandritae]